MLSDHEHQLLTAYIDGELTPQERKAVVRLLQGSREARALLRALQLDAARIAKLPRLKLGPDFSERVVRAAREQTLERRAVAGIPAACRAAPWWLVPALAAGLIVAVSTGSFVYFGRPGTRAAGPVVADGPGPHVSEPGPEVVAHVLPPVTPDPPIPERLPPPAVVADGPPPLILSPVPGHVGKGDNGGKPAVAEPSALTVPLDDMEMFKPTVAAVALTPLENVRDLDAGRLARQFTGEGAWHLELPCRETAVGVRRLEAALRGQGFHLVVDPSAQNRLSKPGLRTNFAVWVEDLTGEELARVLARLGSDDRKAAEAKPRPDGQFSKMVLNPLSDADRKELAQLLRADLQPVKAARAGARPERLALLVAYNPQRPQAGSAQLKFYFDNRRPLRAGGVQALLVLREARN